MSSSSSQTDDESPQAPEPLSAVLSRHFLELFDREEGVRDVDDSASDVVDAWRSALAEPADPKVAKYAKAVARILGEPCTLYFAIEYRDAATLKNSEAFAALMPLPSRYRADGERRADAWHALKVMNALACVIGKVEAPRVPTPAEIEANITQFRALKRAAPPVKGGGGAAAASGAGGSMQRAFQEKLLQLAELLPAEPKAAMVARLQAVPAAKLGELSAAWSAAPYNKRSQPFGGSALAADERAALTALSPSEWERAEQALRQLNDLSRVQTSIPAGMLGKIEGYANDLAHKITSGDSDIGGLDLQSIGEDVLRNCSSEDIDDLAANIGSLLPALGSLQKTVETQAGEAAGSMPALPPGALNALSMLASSGPPGGLAIQ